MTKLARDARAFARRAQMSSAAVWVVVEGRAHDRSFYDRVLGSAEAICEAGYVVRLAEQIELNNVSAGGKQHALNVASFLESEDLLTSTSKSGPRVIVFALDRDYDSMAGLEHGSAHVIYTEAADVEAEILTRGNVRRAASSAYSLPESELADHLASGPQLALDLAAHWREWITLGVCAFATGCGHLRFSQLSQVNAENGFGPVDVNAVGSISGAIEARLGHDEKQTLERARSAVSRSFTQGEPWKLVKGKWIARYVWRIASQAFDTTPREKNVSADVLTETCLETLDFQGDWVGRYHTRIGGLLAA